MPMRKAKTTATAPTMNCPGVTMPDSLSDSLTSGRRAYQVDTTGQRSGRFDLKLDVFGTWLDDFA